MFDSLIAFISSNQLLVGGIGTLAFGSLMYLLRALPQPALHRAACRRAL